MLLVRVAILLVDQVRLKRLEHDVAHIKDSIEWSHLLVGKTRGELLLEVVLKFALLTVEDVGNVRDHKQLASALGKCNRFYLNAENLRFDVFFHTSRHASTLRSAVLLWHKLVVRGDILMHAENLL